MCAVLGLQCVQVAGHTCAQSHKLKSSNTETLAMNPETRCTQAMMLCGLAVSDSKTAAPYILPRTVYSPVPEHAQTWRSTETVPHTHT